MAASRGAASWAGRGFLRRSFYGHGVPGRTVTNHDRHLLCSEEGKLVSGQPQHGGSETAWTVCVCGFSFFFPFVLSCPGVKKGFRPRSRQKLAEPSSYLRGEGEEVP